MGTLYPIVSPSTIQNLLLIALLNRPPFGKPHLHRHICEFHAMYPPKSHETTGSIERVFVDGFSTG